MAFDEMKEKVTPKNPSRDPSPNRGTALSQEDAIPPIRKPLRAWQSENNIDTSSQIKLRRISHMRYQHPDLDEITTFLRDFGMTVAKKTPTQRWYKGYGTDQYVYYAEKGEKKFLGGAFEVSSFADLEKASRLPGASDIIDLTDAPGGGHMVTVPDPAGFPVNLLFGQTPSEGGPMPEILTTNYESHKPRIARFLRFKPVVMVHAQFQPRAYGFPIHRYTRE
ncbi:hypothetical protein M011DRAFT_529454 [Sporormia fimetaria CBS 119925]|uniref:VOC domain-containing protein n=1 Tax=Sporormia fimetaria CBS 119925 TaxID=1340428 RepID=A0A6A6UXP6_9PLEO|nr:hypothetical protein M011DRAFT_529454 [Sporormia fimetaria CBS 119925]